MEQAFRKAGVPSLLHTVGDGQEALAYLRGEGAYADRARFPFPDAVLLDLNMPNLDGFEVLQALRSEPAWNSLPVFVLSASNVPADVRRAHALHANAYIVKPSRLDELVAFAGALQQWLRFTSRPHATRAAAS